MADPMRIRAEAAGSSATVRVLMSHEMETGLRKDRAGKTWQAREPQRDLRSAGPGAVGRRAGAPEVDRPAELVPLGNVAAAWRHHHEQGGDMVRVGSMSYTLSPGRRMGGRIGDIRLKGRPIEAASKSKVAGWAQVAEEARTLPGVKPAWAHVETWLESQGGRVKPRGTKTLVPTVALGNPGLA